MIGYIPEKIVYICQDNQTVSRNFDDLDDSTEVNVKVTPAFVSDATNQKTIETGLKWAGKYTQEYKKLPSGSYGYVTKDSGKDVKMVTIDNTPIKNICIVNLEHRGNGGRAYKVITEDNYYFDLREDVLLDLMIEVGITKGGIINGEYIWARINSEMKLIRVNSDLHRVMIESTKLHVKGKVKSSELIVGGLYKSKTEESIFLGYGHTIDFKYNYQGYNQNLNLNPPFYKLDDDSRYVYEFIKPKKKEIWLSFYIDDDKKINIPNLIKNEYTSIKAVASSSFIDLIKTIEVPDNVLELVREKGYKELMKGINEHKGYLTRNNKSLMDTYNLELKRYEERETKNPNDGSFFYNPKPKYPILKTKIDFCPISQNSFKVHLFKSNEPIQLCKEIEEFWPLIGFDLEAYNKKLK